MRLCYLFSAKTAWQLVNRKADFFLQNESIRIVDSHNESNRFESRIWILYRTASSPGSTAGQERQIQLDEVPTNETIDIE